MDVIAQCVPAGKQSQLVASIDSPLDLLLEKFFFLLFTVFTFQSLHLSHRDHGEFQEIIFHEIHSFFSLKSRTFTVFSLKTF